jgi:DNA-directed RNA polymerase alpha subunit
MNDKCKSVFEEMMVLVPVADFMEIKKRRHGKFEFPVYLSEKLRNTELEALELSVRSSNCLHRAGFKTIGELVESIDGSEDLKKIRNCGSKSVDEIMEQLFCYQYCQLEAAQKIKYINSVLELNNAV